MALSHWQIERKSEYDHVTTHHVLSTGAKF